MDGKVSPELQQFLAQEQQKAQLQQTISALTSTCWDKCVGTPGRYLGSREEQCLSDCAKRFLETTQVGNAWAFCPRFLLSAHYALCYTCEPCQLFAVHCSALSAKEWRRGRVLRAPAAWNNRHLGHAYGFHAYFVKDRPI